MSSRMRAARCRGARPSRSRRTSSRSSISSNGSCADSTHTSLRAALRAARDRIRKPFSATRNRYPVRSSIRSIESHRSHSFRKASCISSAASARFPVTKYRASKSFPLSSEKNTEKSRGASVSRSGRLTTSPSACIALLDAAGGPDASARPKMRSPKERRNPPTPGDGASGVQPLPRVAFTLGSASPI